MKHCSLRFARPLSLLIAALSCGGCITQRNFPNRAAEAHCDKAYRCSEVIADGVFGSPQRCVDQVEEMYANLVDDCEDWDAKRAAECIDGIEESSCTAIASAAKPCRVLAAICN